MLLLLACPGRAEESLSGGGVVVRFPPDARATAGELLRVFPPLREAAARWLDVEPAGEPRLVLVRDHEAMEQEAGGAVPDWAVAIALPDDRIVFRLDLLGRTPAVSPAHVAAHEAVHQVLRHNGGTPLPRWFEEGLCVRHAGVPFLDLDYRLERIAAAGNLPSFADADRSFAGDEFRAAVGYRMGQVVVDVFIARFGEEALRRLLRDLAKGATFAEAFLDATGLDLGTFERGWREAITPALPFLLYVMLENLELTLLVLGAFAVVAGYVRWRWRRESAMRVLDRLP